MRRSNSTRPTSRLDTPTLILRALRAPDTRAERQCGSSVMPRKSTSSVRISYPPFDTAWLVRTLGERIDRLASVLPLRRVVLFGSYAKGTYTVASDVDLLVVYQGEPRPDAYALVKRTLGIPRLEPH